MNQWIKRLGILAVGLAGLGAGMCVAGNMYMKHQSAPRMVNYQADIEPKYVAIVLGARVYPGGKVSNSLKERLVTALWLYKQGKVKRILVTGDHRQAHYNEVKAMYKWLVRKGVPKKDIFLDHAGFRTFDSMARASRLFKVKDAIICTQEFHMARSVYLARHHGIDAVGMNSSGELYYVINRIKVREVIARMAALLDCHILGTEPHHWGDEMPITGPANITHPKD